MDDYGKVFERSGIVVVPTEGLKPEYTWNAELRIANEIVEDAVDFELAAFYTLIQDVIVQTPSQLNGSDSLLYEGELAQIAVNANEDEAFIYGGSAALTVRFDDQWTWTTTATKTMGEVSDTGVPLGAYPPFLRKDRLGL